MARERRRISGRTQQQPFGDAIQVGARHLEVCLELVGAAHRRKQQQRRQVVLCDVGVGQQLRRDRPDRQRVRHAVLRDQIEHAGDVHLRHQHRGHARQHRRDQRIELSRVVQQRQRPDHAAVGADAIAPHPARRMPEVFGMEARDDLRHASRSAGKLEAQHVAARERHAGEALARAGQRHAVDQGIEARCAGRAASHDDEMPQRCMLLDHARSEGSEVEAVEIRLHEIAVRAGLPRQLADLDLAVLRQRTHRHDAGLVAAEQHDGGLDVRAELEDGAVTGAQPEVQQCRGQALGDLVELAKAQRALVADEGRSIGVAPRGGAQRIADGRVDPRSAGDGRVGALDGRVGHAVDGAQDAGHVLSPGVIRARSRSSTSMRPCTPPVNRPYQTAGLSPRVLRRNSSGPLASMQS